MSFAAFLKKNPRPESILLSRFEELLEPKSDVALEKMAGEACRLTRQFFGKTMRLFAPLYLSNECVNICKYCGFSRDNPILRTTLTVDQVMAEGRYLSAEGFRSILLVAGEHPRFVSGGYLKECVGRLRTLVPSVSLEVGPMEEADYRPIVQAGADGLVVYQETYCRATYEGLHTAGPKKDYDWRLECPERAAAAGFKRIGIGALLGLAPWKEEARMVASHADYLLRHCWKSFLTISMPRLRPAAGEFQPGFVMEDREFAQLIFALRITFPQVGLVLSTREKPSLRDGLVPLGVTMMSAGARTDPGGYTGVGREKVHRTNKKGAVPVIESEGEHAPEEQFDIADERSAGQVADRLKSLGFEPVWKDWEYCL